MRIAAVAANVAQLVIILAILFIGGLDLGSVVIGLLFMLMPVPFINFLALFFSIRPPLDEGWDEENGIIKRQAKRIRYHDERCASLETNGTVYAVLDLSEGGVRIRAASATPFKKRVNGEIRLVSGARLRFKATLMRKEENEAVFQFMDPIGTALFVEEEKAVATLN